MRRLGLIAAAVALVATACSNPMPLDEYAELLTTTTDGYVVESQNLSYDYQKAVEDGAREIVASGADDAEEQVLILARQQTAQYLGLLSDAMLRYHAALSEMEPPGEVADAHGQFVDAVGAVLKALPAAKQGVEDAESLDEIQQALTASGFADGQFRWTATCSSLEQSIKDAGQAVNLRCVKPTEVGGSP